MSFWDQATDTAPSDEPLEVAMARTMAQLLEQARNPPPPQPCLHMEPYPGWARQQVREGLDVVDCLWCGVPVRLPGF